MKIFPFVLLRSLQLNLNSLPQFYYSPSARVEAKLKTLARGLNRGPNRERQHMAQAMMDPEKVRRFADDLQRFNTDLENRLSLLQARSSLNPFGAVPTLRSGSVCRAHRTGRALSGFVRAGVGSLNPAWGLRSGSQPNAAMARATKMCCPKCSAVLEEDAR